MPTSGIIDGIPLYLIGAANPFSSFTKLELPVFRPNDYFFEHHQREGEEKWETYARVIRDIMSEVSGLPKIEQSIEDKFAYKDLLYPKKDKKTA